MSIELAQDLADAICRRSPLIADNTGLMLTGQELAAIYEIVGKHYLREKVTHPFIPSIADLLEIYSKLDGPFPR